MRSSSSSNLQALRMSMGAYDRMDRINELLLGEIAQLLQRDIKDPRIGFVSVIRVDTNRDLQHARVYVSIYGEEDDKAQALEGLSSASGFIRKQLFRNLSLKTVPRLSFVLDESITRGARIASILRDLEEEEGDVPADSKKSEEEVP